MILAIDIGSTQMKLLLMNENAEVVDSDSEQYSTLTPHAGYLEQDPTEWSNALKKGIHKLRAKRNLEYLDIDCISFSGHMSSVIPLDKDGIPLMNCIMLSDSRSQKQCEKLRDFQGEKIAEVTGNPVINAFSLPKLLWIKENAEEIYRKMAVWVNAKDYLRYLLTGNLGTEYTDAYNSIAVNPNTLDYDKDIIRGCGLDPRKFPEIHSPYKIAGYVTKTAADYYEIQEGTPVAFGAADMACAAVGNTLFQNGDSTLTLGTSATFFAILPYKDPKTFGKITYHLHTEENKMYALGSHFNGGLAVNFITRIMNSNQTVDYEMISKISKEAEKVKIGSGGVLTIPFLVGSGSPYFNALDRQSILFMNPGTTREELFRSEIEGVSYNIRETYELYHSILGHSLNNIILGGGGVHISLWPQILSDIMNTEILISENMDASTIGAAIIGGKACGMFQDVEKVSKKIMRIQKVVHPNRKSTEQYDALYHRYLHCYQVLRSIF